jgi:hypothetical protein
MTLRVNKFSVIRPFYFFSGLHPTSPDAVREECAIPLFELLRQASALSVLDRF